MKKIAFSVASFLLLISLSFALFCGSIYLLFGDRPLETGDIAVIKVEGPIYSADEILKQIDRVKKEDSFKGVLFRVNTPGGTVAAAQEIHEAILALRKSGKKVLVSMETVAASGGYYLAVAADWIVADPGTITGSIGVRLEYMNVEELLQWAKLKRETLKSGKFKDIASPIREMSLEERALLQDLLGDMHNQFKQAIASGRNLPLETVEALADGRVFSGREAHSLKLVDQLGGYGAALEKLASLSGIVGEAKPVEIPSDEGSFIEQIFESRLGALFEQLASGPVNNLIVTKPIPMSIW